jgi:hypothetical protein
MMGPGDRWFLKPHGASGAHAKAGGMARGVPTIAAIHLSPLPRTPPRQYR